MPAFDRLFLDPSEDELARALAEAVGQANYRCRVGKLPPEPDEYRRRAAEALGTREGSWRQVGGVTDPYACTLGTRATLLGLAWWTDVLGRRHARVAGRRLEEFNEFHGNRFGLLNEVRPPLSLVHPERVFLRTRPGRPREVLALCACGALGAPAGLGWVGDRCGPCHDRGEEGVAVRADPRPLTLRGHTGGATAVAFSASGKTVVSAGRAAERLGVGTGAVLFWERDTGSLRQTHFHDFHLGTATLPFACDGRTAVADGHDTLAGWDAETGAPGMAAAGRGLDVLALAPDGEALTGFGDGRLVVWGPGTGYEWEELWSLSNATAYCLTLEPGGRTVAVGLGQGLVTFSPRRGEKRHGFGEGCVRAVAFDPAGRRLLTGKGQEPGLFASESPDDTVPGRVQLWEGAGWETPRELPSHRGPALAVAFTLDGGLAVSAGADRKVRFCDVQTGSEVAALEWHVGAVTALAFTPDGEMLATAGADGLIRLWPWRRLLDAP